jgi:hypothetical protein
MRMLSPLILLAMLGLIFGVRTAHPVADLVLSAGLLGVAASAVYLLARHAARTGP